MTVDTLAIPNPDINAFPQISKLKSSNRLIFPLINSINKVIVTLKLVITNISKLFTSAQTLPS